MIICNANKQVLASLRDLYKPLDFKQIEEEQKQKEELSKAQIEERRQQRSEWQKQNMESYDFKKFSSRYTSRVLEEDMEKKELELQKEEHRRNLHQKMRSYNDKTKRHYGPVVSTQKQEEVKKRRQSLEIPPREKYKQIVSDQEERQKIYNERMKAYKRKQKKLTQTPNPPKHQGSVDYLREFRLRRSDQSPESHDVIPKSKLFGFAISKRC